MIVTKRSSFKHKKIYLTIAYKTVIQKQPVFKTFLIQYSHDLQYSIFGIVNENSSFLICNNNESSFVNEHTLLLLRLSTMINLILISRHLLNFLSY